MHYLSIVTQIFSVVVLGIAIFVMRKQRKIIDLQDELIKAHQRAKEASDEYIDVLKTQIKGLKEIAKILDN